MECLMSAKRFVSVALTLLLAVSFAAPSGARALSADGFEYAVTGSAATVTGCDGACPTTLNIPAVLGGYYVTTIGASAFASNDLTTVTIPNSVTTIDDYAFQSNDLTTVTIPNSVTTIDDYAFQSNALTTVTIGNSVTSIGAGAFGNNALTTVTIPNSVTSIGETAFEGNALTTVTIGNSVTSIGSFAFHTNALTTVTIPNSVTSIGDYAFDNNALTTVTIGNSVTSIGVGAFEDNFLTSVTIPNSVTTIGASAFYSNALTTVTIGNSVTSIGSFAFNTNALTTVTIGNSVTTIGASAFYSNALTTVTIGNSVTSIGSFAFHTNALTSVTFLGNAPTAGTGVFEGNTALTSVSRPYTATGWGSTWSGVPVVIADARATATVKPSMSGTVAVGKTLTAAPGTWAGYPTPTLTYKWYACTRAVTAARDAVPSTCKVISGATRSTFKLTTAQRGKYVAVLVTGASLGTAATTWLSTTSVDVRATAIYKPAIRGTTTVGKTLTAAKGTWTGYPTPTFTYQWYACTRAVTIARTTVPSTCVQISGATRSTFKLTTAQRGKYVAVLVTGTSLRTTATTWLSKTTSKVR
jgi:hypothetical protein